MNTFFIGISISILIGAAIGIGIYFSARYLRRKIFSSSLSLKLFLIRIPKEQPPQGAGEKDFKNEINRSEQLFTSLLALKKPFVFELAVPHIGEEISFYLAVPRDVSEIAVKQIQGIWNGASVTPADDDYNIFNVNGATAAAYLLQKEDSSLPIRTYSEIGADTFSSVIGGLSKISELGEGAAFQLIMRPTGSEFKKRVYKYLEQLKRGEPLKKITGSDFLPRVFETVGEVFSPGSKEEKKEKIVDEEAFKALEFKVQKPLFLINARILTSAPTPFAANDILEGIAAGFEQFGSPRRNSFKIIKAKNPNQLAYQFSFRIFNSKQAMILNSEEIASFFHLPVSGTETPKVKWLRAKEAAPPADLPQEGTLIGESLFRGQVKPVYITDNDRMRHVYAIGQTGTGKSTLLINMAVEDIKRGKGIALIDPHGESAEKVLSSIPKERMDDLIYFDPADRSRPMGLNMLEYNFDRPEEKTFIINELLSIFDKLYDLKTTGGPIFEQYMRNALHLLMEDMPNEEATLVEVPRIFTDSEYRNRKVNRITNPVVIDFWQKEASKVGGEMSLANVTPYITSKFNTFIANDYMRPIIGQARSAFNFRKIMDEGKIFIINLSKGRLGDINANLLGMIFTGRILIAALSRVDIPENERREFNLYIDEFQNFTTDSIAMILSEARKYKLSLAIAHQFIAQLTEKIRDAVFGNVGSQVVFRVGVQDAEFLTKQFEPVFNQNDLINIENFNAYLKILINGQPSKPFNIRTLTPKSVNPEYMAKLIEYSRSKYGMDLDTVEKEILRRLRE